MNIIKREKFEKELKKLSKKYKSIEEDLQTLLPVIINSPEGNKSKHWNCLKKEGDKYIFKIRLLCRSVGSSSFRIIYFYDGKNIELEFIEIYFKGNKENEDKKRVEEIWEEKFN